MKQDWGFVQEVSTGETTEASYMRLASRRDSRREGRVTGGASTETRSMCASGYQRWHQAMLHSDS